MIPRRRWLDSIHTTLFTYIPINTDKTDHSSPSFPVVERDVPALYPPQPPYSQTMLFYAALLDWRDKSTPYPYLIGQVDIGHESIADHPDAIIRGVSDGPPELSLIEGFSLLRVEYPYPCSVRGVSWFDAIRNHHHPYLHFIEGVKTGDYLFGCWQELVELGEGIVFVEDDQFCVLHPHEEGELADGGEELGRLEAGWGEEEVHGQPQHSWGKNI
jgi:hypothetical protein